MKNFRNYMPEKYSQSEYLKVEEGIYRTKNPYGNDMIYVTSLAFELEPGCYGEDEASPANPPQVPIEGILDEFFVFVTDFYEQLNKTSQTVCYQEFGSSDLSDIQKLRTLIGKRFYAASYIDEKDGEEYYKMVVEKNYEK